MVSLSILNSTFTISVALQNWTGDNRGPLFEALVRDGFIITPPTVTQQGRISKNKITALGVDDINRRIAIQITNNINSPKDDLQNVLSVLSTIGFPSTESVERIDIQGGVTIKIQDEGTNASLLVSEVVEKSFIAKTDEIFGRSTKAIGLRLASVEPLIGGASRSPFVLLIEPLLTDDANKKMVASLTYSSSSANAALEFIETLYDRLKSLIGALTDA